MTIPTTIHLTFRTDASGDLLIDKASPEPFVGSSEYVRADQSERAAIVAYLRDVALDHDRRSLIAGHKQSGRYHAEACCMAAKYIEQGEHLATVPPAPSDGGL